MVFREGEHSFHNRSRDESEWFDEHPFQVEPGDWYTHDQVMPNYMLTGNRMLRLLKRMGEWPLEGSYSDSPMADKSRRTDLIRRAITISRSNQRRNHSTCKYPKPARNKGYKIK